MAFQRRLGTLQRLKNNQSWRITDRKGRRFIPRLIFSAKESALNASVIPSKQMLASYDRNQGSIIIPKIAFRTAER